MIFEGLVQAHHFEGLTALWKFSQKLSAEVFLCDRANEKSSCHAEDKGLAVTKQFNEAFTE